MYHQIPYIWNLVNGQTTSLVMTSIELNIKLRSFPRPAYISSRSGYRSVGWNDSRSKRWVVFLPQIYHVSSPQAADEPPQQRGRAQGGLTFNNCDHQLVFMFKCFRHISLPCLVSCDNLSSCFSVGIILPCGLAPSSNIYKSNHPLHSPTLWKNPIYPTKRLLASLAHIIVRCWPLPL